jgi:hypothetical protein
MVARIGEAREALQQDLELEEVLDLSVHRHARKPGLARLRLFAAETARVAQEVVVRVSLFCVSVRAGVHHALHGTRAGDARRSEAVAGASSEALSKKVRWSPDTSPSLGA